MPACFKTFTITFLLSSVELLDIQSKVPSPSSMQPNDGGEGNVPVLLCVFASMDFAHYYREYFSPMCVHCAVHWTSATGRENQRLFLISHFMLHRDVAVWIDTGLQLFKVWIATQNFLAKQKVEESVSTLTVAGVRMCQ